MESSKNNTIPTLFCENVVWDAALFNTVQRMRPEECEVVAKWTTYSLRRDSPTFLTAFRELEGTQQVLASADVRLQVIAANDVDEQDEEDVAQFSDLLERRRVSTDEKLRGIYANINEYRRATGYRSLSLLTLGAEHGHSKATIAAANALRILNKGQAGHLESMLLVARLRAFQKLDPARMNEKVADEMKSLQCLLECHTAKAIQIINGINVNCGGKTAQEMHKEFISKCPAVSDTILKSINESSCAMQVFRAANRSLTIELSGAINHLVEDYFPVGRIFPDAA